MQTMIQKHTHILTLTKIILFGVSLLMTSCFYSGKYLATYTVHNPKADKDTKELAVDFINQLADKNTLTKDTKFNGTDTLSFFGRPYHYFKFWFEQKDKYTVVKLDYWGISGSRKNQPYKDLFNELNDFMKANFIIIEQDIKEENNSKKKENLK